MNYADYIEAILSDACRLEGYVEGMGDAPCIGDGNATRLSDAIRILQGVYEKVTRDE